MNLNFQIVNTFFMGLHQDLAQDSIKNGRHIVTIIRSDAPEEGGKLLES